MMINMELIMAEIVRVADQLDEKEYPESVRLLREIAYTDDPEDLSPYSIAGSLADSDKPKTLPAVLLGLVQTLYETEIAEGNADAMNDLGAQYYEGGRGFRQDFSKAVYYYELAAKHGNRQAQENLGYCYYYGRDMEPDYEKAFHYFALGAFDGHLISLYNIGDMYLNGYYVEKNEREAFLIYMRCLETMTQEAEKYAAGPVYLRLGKMFQEGLGTEVNLKSALVCYQKAEAFLFDMVMDGSIMYRMSLEKAVLGQESVRKLLAEKLPEGTWVD